jgi:hypothetical protein
MKTRIAFNATTQTEEEAIVTIDANGEYVFTFEDKSFFKLPGDLDKKGIADALATYKAHNEGQVTAAAIEEANQEKLKNI